MSNRKHIEEQALQTLNELERIIKGEKLPGGAPLPEPDALLYVALDERQRAEAIVLEELIDIVLPELGLRARTIRAHYTSQDEVGEVETLAGTQPARHRQAEWLDVPGQRLHGSRPFLGAAKDSQEGETGMLISHDLWLLTDGRLVEVSAVARTRLVSKRLLKQWALLETHVVKPLEAVADFSFDGMLMSLRSQLRLHLPELQDKHVPDLAERQARFDAVVTEYTNMVSSFAEELRHVGDLPA
ncbi:hypothetical protein [Hyalangium rubrum]|uniref:Uncharacterized protein n=1 Tax=Hyalangium rubrum TaxID=3103134 RepID=A0ABU5H660_9BACT|nr:hypothetical protein [Hyalangium sp. s54d21]MDY7228359.1 hypothetical protein [Hyalangium sp. s54d21]